VSKDIPALAAEIARAGRNTKKLGLDAHQRHVDWERRAAEHGFDPSSIQELRAERLVQDVQPAALIDHALSELTETEAVFQLRDLYRAIASASVSLGASRIDIETLASSSLAQASVVELKSDPQGNRRFTTKEMIGLERGLATMARLAQSRRFVADTERFVTQAILDEGLSSEQAAVARAMTVDSAIGLFEGAAGTGKSTTLKVIAGAYKQAGCRVIGAATAWKIANQIAADCEIEARATDAWSSTGTFLDSRTVLLVDEAGPVFSMARLSWVRTVVIFKLLSSAISRNSLPSASANTTLASPADRPKICMTVWY
jgi:ATP-dependent exoDNAse (exonuclease V) alpha subunit